MNLPGKGRRIKDAREGALGNSASAAVNRQTRKRRKEKGGGIGEKAGEKKEREKKRTANPWVNVTTG